jgi:hypothetical protein
MVKSKFPWVFVLENKYNIGLAKAHNQAFTQSRGRFCLFVDPDTIITPGALATMVGFMDDHPKAGVAACKLFNPDGTLQYSCRTYVTPLIALLRRTPLGKLFPNSRLLREYLMCDWDHNDIRTVDWVLGAFLIVRREPFQKIGQMDEKFFLYGEDQDCCLRMNRHGWKVYYVPTASIIHAYQREGARGLNRKTLIQISEYIYFYRKHFAWIIFRK